MGLKGNGSQILDTHRRYSEGGMPQKQSLAIAYAMKRKRMKMADGGKVDPTPTPDPSPIIDPDEATKAQSSMRQAFGYADGGKVKGVHESYYDDGEGGESRTGALARNIDLGKGRKEMAVNEHNRVLGEMKSMPKPKLQGMAEGGEMHHGGCQCPGCCEMMAQGGQITDNYQPSNKVDTKPDLGFHEFDKDYVEHEGDVKRPNMMAMGEDGKRLNKHPVGMHAETSMEEEDLVDRIMMNRKQNSAGEAKYSEGGKVANQDEIEAGFDPNEFDDLHLRDDLESSYGEDDNAGDDLGNKQEDKDRADLVDRIMLKNFKQKIPRGYPGR